MRLRFGWRFRAGILSAAWLVVGSVLPARAEVGPRLRPLVQRSYRVSVVRGRAYVAATVGLRILDVRRPGKPRLLGSLVIPGSANDVAVWRAPRAGLGARGRRAGDGPPAHPSTVAVLAAGPEGLVFADVSRPRSPRAIARLDTRGSANGLAFGRAGLLFVADGGAGVVAVDVSDPRRPAVRARARLGCYAWSVSARGNWLYVACGRDGMRVLPVSVRRGRVALGKPIVYALPGTVRGFTWGSGRTLYVAAGEAGVHVLDGRRPRNLRRVATARVEDFARGVSAWGARLAVAAGESGVWLFDLRRRNRPVLRGRYRTAKTRSAIGVQLRRSHLFVAYDHAGVHVLAVTRPGKLVRRAVFTVAPAAGGRKAPGNG